ncbi:hypothetical protein B0H14DRAFT_2719398, partial [Mycena olivaceomarginata]
MSITQKEMETLHRKFSRRLEKIRQEFDEDMMDLFLRFKTSAPKTKKQVASIPKISKPLVTKGSTNQKPVRPSARNGAHWEKREAEEQLIIDNALRIPPIFEASEIENLRKPALEKLLADLGGPTNAKNNKDRAAEIIIILEQRRAAAAEKGKTTGKNKSASKARNNVNTLPSKSTKRTKSPKAKEPSVEPADEYDNVETHRLVEIDDDELANASDDYSPQAVTYGDEDDRMEEDED